MRGFSINSDGGNETKLFEIFRFSPQNFCFEKRSMFYYLQICKHDLLVSLCCSVLNSYILILPILPQYGKQTQNTNTVQSKQNRCVPFNNKMMLQLKVHT